jgi:hypothetical protein
VTAADFTEVRLLFTGSRWWSNPVRIREELDLAWHDAVQAYGLPIRLVLVYGDCPETSPGVGADAIAAAWAEANRPHGVVPEPHAANWDLCGPGCPPSPTHRRVRRPGDRVHPGTAPTYCPGAGPRRNDEMVALGAAMALAAPDPNGPSSGTRHCMAAAASAGIPVRVITP